MSGAATPTPAEPLVLVRGMIKSFGGVRALRGVDFDVRPGEVHALLGENGAGKSTLIKILSGVHASDGGRVEIDGRPVSFASPAQSRQAGIAVVYQDLSLVESLSVAANLMLGREPRTWGFLRKRRLMNQAADFLRRHGIPLDPRAIVGDLPFAYRQLTEICKALMGDARILILDEPTSALTGDEEQILFDAIRRVTARGVGVVYVTHRLNEVFRISQRVTVLRDGLNAQTFATDLTSMEHLVAAIVGPGHAPVAQSGAVAGSDREARPAGVALSLDGVLDDRLRGVDLEVREGEIHGLAGLVGSGRTEILETVFGLRRQKAGRVEIGDRVVGRHGPAEAIALGVALVPEDRHLQGLVLDHSIERNLALPRLPHLSRLGWLRQAASLSEARDAMRRLAVKAPGPATACRSLSGGNQQKVVFAKWNAPRPRILLLDEPTVGVDVGAREEIYGLVRDAARAGTAVLLVSSDLGELLQLCDRISVVTEGRITDTVLRGQLRSTEELHVLIQRSVVPEARVA